MSLVLQAYHLLAHCQPSLGGPIGGDVEPDLVAAGNNLTILRVEIAPAWTSSAKLRGTSDVLWSCLVTLTACIYTSIHLNVPQNKDGKDGRWVLLKRHIGWAIVTLLAPELVIYMALSQYLKARRLCDQLKSTKTHTLAYGFYATMGGFVTELVAEMHNTLTRVTISDQGVLFLASCKHFCDIDDYTISNKSKAGLVGKALIIIQVVWMAIQCVARYAHGYPLALLEVHTMVHVVCALILYGLWWPKPQDVADPTLINTSAYPYPQLIALMLTQSHVYKNPKCVEMILYDSDNSHSLDNPNPSTTTAEQSTDPDVTIIAASATINSDKTRTDPYLRTNPRQSSLFENPSNNLVSNQSHPRIEFFCPECHNSQPGGRKSSELGHTTNTKDIHRQKLAREALEYLFPEPRDKQRNVVEEVNRLKIGDGLLGGAPNMNDNVIHAFFTMDILSISDLPKCGAMFAACIPLTVLYGGIHLSAWNFQFPSRIEKVMWQAACFVIMGSFFAIGGALAVASLLVYLWGLNRDGGDAVNALELLGRPFRAAVILVYACARIYIVVEAFLSLRHVPIGVYATIPWIQNIPHF